MTTLVTGASGFIGKHLTRDLLAREDGVVAYDLAACPAEFQPIPGLRWVQGDIANYEAIRSLFQQHRPTRVVHLAYLLPPQSEQDPASALQSNVVGFLHVLKAAAECGTVRRVVWSSSMAAYGPAHRYEAQPATEDAPTYPTSLYGATKVMAEALARHYFHTRDLSVLGFRANLVYGPGRERGLGNFKIWSRDMFYAALRGHAISVPAADQELDWIYVLDVVRAIEAMLDVEEVDSLIFNVLGDWRPVRDAVAALRTHCPGASLRLESGKLPPDQQSPTFDGRRARMELGYQPQFTLERGVAAYLAAIADEGGASP